MLKKYITDFLAYCKVTAFSSSSIKSLHANLKDFAAFVDEQPIGTMSETEVRGSGGGSGPEGPGSAS